MLLTISIGVASTDSFPNANAQNSALSQNGDNGNNEVKQKREQSQSSNQDNQEISGDSSILSGNNILCQDQSNVDLAQLNSLCNASNIDNSQPSLDYATLKITTIQRANCHFHPCPLHDGVVYVSSVYGTKSFLPATRTAGGVTHFEMDIPIGVTYQIRGEGSAPLPWMWTFEGANIQNERNACASWNQCTATMPADGASVIVNFHYICNDSTC